MMMGKQVRETRQNSPSTSTNCQLGPRPFASPEPEHEYLDREARFGYSFGEINLFPIQPKLKLGPPGDRYEQEADRVAEQVVQMVTPCPKCRVESEEGDKETFRAKPIAYQITSLVQRQEANPEEMEVDEELLQPKQPDGRMPQVDPCLEAQIQGLRSGGQPLDAANRAFFEPRFGADFGHVRVHTDAKAAESARAIRAAAYTVGQHVVFAAGGYAPHTTAGKQLLAHELVHTCQQGQVADSQCFPLEISTVNDISEHEADQIAQYGLTQYGESKPKVSTAELSVQRACGSRAIGHPEGCSPFGGVGTTEISNRIDERFLFEVNCDDFRPGEEARLRNLAARVGARDVIDIHGFASEEGPVVFNEHLSCARIRKAESVLIAAGVPARQIRGRYKHGATPGSRPENRSVVIPLAEPPTIGVLGAGFVGPPSASQRRAAASCPIECDGTNLGTLNAMGLFFHASRGGIVPAGGLTATGVGTSLHFTATAIDIARGTPCYCDSYRIIQILDTTHPAAGRVSPYVDNAGRATPFYGDVGLSGSGIHEIPAGYPDAGERVQSTRSIYDRPYRTTGSLGGRDLRWEAESCVTCVKVGQPDRILGCTTYGFARTYNVASASYNPVTGIGPGCRAVPSARFLNALRSDPTVATYDFEGK